MLMGEATKTPYHHGDLRDSLLAAAEQALAELPLQHVTLREIARRAHVSHAAPKHHFASLGQLLGEVSARGFDRFIAAIGQAANRAAEQSPVARLTAMVRAYLRFAVENPAVYGLMFGKREHVVETTPHLATSMLAAWAQLENQVAAMIGPARAPYGAVTVWANVHGLAMLRLERKLPPHINPDIAIENLTQTLIVGLKAEP
jgi:AcrR family transcriptional regulator